MVTRSIPHRRRPDAGAVLVLTLVLTVILGLFVAALARYATTGLRTSDAPTYRTETNFDAASAVTWAIEEFAAKRLTPDGDCGDAPVALPVPLPSGLIPNGYSATLTCAQTTPIAGEPVVHLVATVTPPDGGPRFVEATVEVPAYIHGARVSDWRVDIPIAVPPYVPTTTTPTGTTTTTLPLPNPPTASVTNVTVNSPGVFNFFLNASDDPWDTLTASVTLSAEAAAAGWSVAPIPAGSLYVELTVPAGLADGTSLSIPYSVQDLDGLTDSSTVEVTVTTTPVTTTTTTTTTTTLPPNPTCEFALTSVSNNKKEGSGTLSLRNVGGGAFTGWSVNVAPSSWAFSWSGDIGVAGAWTITNGASTASVAADESGVPVASALVTSGPPGGQLSLGQTFPCTVISP